MKIFEDFYELYGRVEREAERVEIVLGDGILSWRRQEGTVAILSCGSANSSPSRRGSVQ